MNKMEKVNFIWVDSENKDTYIKKELHNFCKREKNKFSSYHQLDKNLIEKIKKRNFN